MHPDDDSQTTLSKWPFILGDVLLVATALAIAILGDWQLTSWQVGACVAAVALGAALFVLPYVVEYLVRTREEKEDRAAELRVLEKHMLAVEQTLTASEARIRDLENASEEVEQPESALAELVDQKFAQLAATSASQEEAIHQLQNDLKERPKETPSAFDPEVLKPIVRRLESLEKRPPTPAEKPAPVSTQETPAVPDSPAKVEPAEMPGKTVAQIDRPKRSIRERRGPEESRLLHRAISEKGDHSSTAVSRIIESKSKAPNLERTPVKKAPEPSDPKVPENEEIQETNEVDEAQIVPAPPIESEESEQVIETSTAEESNLLFEEEQISSPVTRTKAKKNDAVLTASVFIGIGNKPYLRGSGGGLSWEEGLLMEFQEIGKWRWVAPPDLDAPLEVQIYRNDEDPDTSGKYTLEPGQKLEINPVF